eukprot:scaffold21443_cov41-Prasinocladus_malaysianus.AAC.1
MSMIIQNGQESHSGEQLDTCITTAQPSALAPRSSDKLRILRTPWHGDEGNNTMMVIYEYGTLPNFSRRRKASASIPVAGNSAISRAHLENDAPFGEGGWLGTCNLCDVLLG